MHGTATEKVPGGKLVRIKVDFDKTINSMQITGDFFLHPEDMVEEIEQCFVGCAVDVDKDLLKNKIDGFIKKNNILLVGVSSDDLARLTKQALQVAPQ